MQYFKCDHIRVVSPSTGKGKDQDWFLPCKIFEFLISMYKVDDPELSKIKIWTDGAPTQYKCRQNLFWVAQCFKKFGIRVIHRCLLLILIF
jgi:hypothetical protein